MVVVVVTVVNLLVAVKIAVVVLDAETVDDAGFPVVVGKTGAGPKFESFIEISAQPSNEIEAKVSHLATKY